MLSGLVYPGEMVSGYLKVPPSSIVDMKLFFFVVIEGAYGLVTSGFQFVPDENTLSSRYFFSCFIFCAFWTRSIYLVMPMADGLTSFYARRLVGLLVFG